MTESFLFNKKLSVVTWLYSQLLYERKLQIGRSRCIPGTGDQNMFLVTFISRVKIIKISHIEQCWD